MAPALLAVAVLVVIAVLVALAEADAVHAPIINAAVTVREAEAVAAQGTLDQATAAVAVAEQVYMDRAQVELEVNYVEAIVQNRALVVLLVLLAEVMVVQADTPK
jgi:hypothetical protein